MYTYVYDSITFLCEICHLTDLTLGRIDIQEFYSLLILICVPQISLSVCFMPSIFIYHVCFSYLIFTFFSVVVSFLI